MAEVTGIELVVERSYVAGIGEDAVFGIHDDRFIGFFGPAAIPRAAVIAVFLEIGAPREGFEFFGG